MKSQCECKGLDDYDSSKNDHIYNPRTCDCECNKACKVDEYLDISWYYLLLWKTSNWWIIIRIWRWTIKFTIKK